MPAGIQIFTNSGTIQIDENYNNLHAADAGNGGVLPPVGNFFNPLLALQLPAFGLPYFGEAVSGKWWVFDILHNWMGTNAGFQVFNAGGGLVFDSGRNPMRLVYHNTNITSPGGITLTAGRQYATIMGSTSGQWVEGSIKAGGANWRNFEGANYMGARVTGGNVVEWNWYQQYYSEWISDTQEYAQGTNWTYSNVPASIMVVDVTGF